MCDVEWASPKAYPSLHYSRKYCCSTHAHMLKQSKMRKTPRERTRENGKES